MGSARLSFLQPGAIVNSLPMAASADLTMLPAKLTSESLHPRLAGLPADRITEIQLEINPAMFQ